MHEFEIVIPFPLRMTQRESDAFFEAGCSDATLCVRDGKLHALFARDAEALEEAQRTAERDIRKALAALDIDFSTGLAQNV